MFKKIWSYLTFQKQTDGDPNSFNLKVMHGINRISLLLFLFGILFLIIKTIIK